MQYMHSVKFEGREIKICIEINVRLSKIYEKDSSLP